MNHNELKHFGVLGMKWGVRRGRNVSSRFGKNKNPTKGWSKDAKEAGRLKQKKVSQLTNTELKTLNTRMSLEDNYRSLTKSNVSKGLAYVATASAMAGTIVGLHNNSSKLITIGKKVVAYRRYLRV